MAPPELSDQQGQQTRTSAAEIHAAIERLLAGEAFLANRPWSEIWWGLMHLDLFSGWRIAIWIKRDALGVCHAASAADGRNWLYGCQRDDWTLGPAARILEPLGLLSPRQRQALEARLRRACCWPAPAHLDGGWMPPLHQLQHPRPRRRASSKPGRTAAAKSPPCPEQVPAGRGTMGPANAPAFKP
ncbi:hypothetical protein [Synechococcus sp. EJ6-Ellesmere]|uniref:DUF7693 family protein n=1 Tax=Synechococcus sp. EJ6-Ellesmere TaxID=2823734 RepID=UPI0020CF2947|nr:hypothetical protein [Synechococcus sp. EJ6-Ellesmere]